MTLNIEEMKQNREAGTPGPWFLDEDQVLDNDGSLIFDWLGACNGQDDENIQRIILVPDMEARILSDANRIAQLERDNARLHGALAELHTIAHASWFGDDGTDSDEEREAIREAKAALRIGRGIPKQSAGASAIASERQRQVEAEGWRPEHDDNHVRYELADAALCYLVGSMWNWPNGWDRRWWKPSVDRRRNLIKAGALIAAEIDRLDRVAARENGNDQ